MAHVNENKKLQEKYTADILGVGKEEGGGESKSEVLEELKRLDEQQGIEELVGDFISWDEVDTKIEEPHASALHNINYRFDQELQVFEYLKNDGVYILMWRVKDWGKDPRGLRNIADSLESARKSVPSKDNGAIFNLVALPWISKNAYFMYEIK